MFPLEQNLRQGRVKNLNRIPDNVVPITTNTTIPNPVYNYHSDPHDDENAIPSCEKLRIEFLLS